MTVLKKMELGKRQVFWVCTETILRVTEAQRLPHNPNPCEILQANKPAPVQQKGDQKAPSLPCSPSALLGKKAQVGGRTDSEWLCCLGVPNVQCGRVNGEVTLLRSAGFHAQKQVSMTLTKGTHVRQGDVTWLAGACLPVRW